MQTIALGQLKFGAKSKHKAGEGLAFGKYKFFTSSDTQSKFLDSFDCEGPALIFGTGGKASVHYCEEKFATSTDCYSLTTDDKNIFLKYIYSYLRGNMYLLEEGFKGAGLEHISKDYLKQITIPLPPLATQRAIADKLDTLQSLIDLKKQAITKTDELAKSIFLEMFGDPMKNEKGREVKKLKDIGKLASGGTPSRGTPDFFKGIIPWITTVSLGKTFVSKDNAVEYITEEAIKKSATKLIPKNSILIGTRVGVGKVSITADDICYNQDITGITEVDKNLNLLFFREFLSYKSESYNDVKRGATIQGITSDVIKNTDIYIPPLPLQQKFADIITQIETQKSEHKLALVKLEELYQAEMQRSFSL